MKFCPQYKGNAIYIGKMQERSLREKSSHALEIILETSSWRNYSLLESILGISSFVVKIPRLHDGRQENFILLLILLFGNSKSNLGDLFAVDAFGKLWQNISYRERFICRACLLTV